MAKLYFRYGAMNSGKSTGLLQAAFNYEERDQRVLLAKPAVDTKGNDEIVSRLGVTRRADFVIPPQADLRQLYHRHATAWILQLGDPAAEYARLADAEFGPVKGAA